ncbi:MAG: hypothetical protein H6656_03310 [Ardenticatenaceae bacterium]|nr:hypothetical protein [Ardenticatenaceae bacterium]
MCTYCRGRLAAQPLDRRALVSVFVKAGSMLVLAVTEAITAAQNKPDAGHFA